jgi:hypothetical protein
MQPVYLPNQDNNGTLLHGDPLLDRPGACPGWFTELEVSVVGPHLMNRLVAPVTIDGYAPDTVHLPTADLDWTGMPRFELGYRFPGAWGEISASYRLLVTEGNATLSNFDIDGGDGFLHSRLNMNVLDLDYGSREFSLDRHWDMRWKVGVRLANVFFDSRATGWYLEQRTANHFIGAGPHVGLELNRTFDVPGLGVYGRVDGSAPIGQVHQSFEETVVFNDGTEIGGATDQSGTKAVPTLGIQFGMAWVPYRFGTWSRFTFGYEFERWWYLGEVGDSRAELTTQGIFFRGEFGF